MDAKPGADDSFLGCPECGSEVFESAEIVNAANRGTGAVSYPYFDQALNCWVESLDQKRAMLKARGWEQADNALDAAVEDFSHEESVRIQRDKEIAEDINYQMEGPNKAEYRRAIDTITEIAARGELDNYFRPMPGGDR
ncbi:MAG TPA: hypothetical protein VI792_03295 [Candidatus Eisenbacteria bacterium]